MVVRDSLLDVPKIGNLLKLVQIALKENRSFRRGYIRVRFGKECDYVVDYVGTMNEYLLTKEDNIWAIPIEGHQDKTRRDILYTLLALVRAKIKERGV